MNTIDVITLAMSRQDGAKAAAEMVSDGRLHPGIQNEWRASGDDWGDPDFSLGDAAQAAFLGSGCEEFSRHHQLAGDNWQSEHIVAFWNEFVSIARACLWAEEVNS